MSSYREHPGRLDSLGFARRLYEAVHDKNHEIDTSVGLRHYWDSSCLAFPVRGFLELPDRYPRVDQTKHLELLVGALFSSGQIGPVHLLPGHALEFAHFVRRSIDTRP